MTTSRTKRKNDADPAARDMAYNMAFIAIVVAFVGLGVAYLIDAMSRDRRSLPELWDTGPTIKKSIADRELSIPPAWFRSAGERNSGFADRIDLIFALPLGPRLSVREIGVTLMPRARARTSEKLLEAVYLHDFLPAQVEGPSGLVGKPLKSTQSAENETVWYDPASDNPFVAKCMAPVAKGARETCMRTVAVSEEVSATYLFDREILENWQRFDEEAAHWLTRIGGLEIP